MSVVSNVCSMSRQLIDWTAVQRRYDVGISRSECAAAFGFTITAWYKAVQRGALQLTDADRLAMAARRPGNWRYDWNTVQKYYDAGHTYAECRAHFGFSAASWAKAVKLGRLRARARAWPIAQVLARAKHRGSVKKRLLEAGILENRCSACGLNEWRGKPLSIQIDHANGIRNDNRLENLRMLCPNCHSQTETFGGRNLKRQRAVPSSLAGRAPDSESGGPSFESKLGSHGPIV